MPRYDYLIINSFPSKKTNFRKQVLLICISSKELNFAVVQLCNHN